MKYISKILITLSLLLIIQQIGYSQEADKTVTLTVIGQGKTVDEARTNALRSAIEQAFGAFISSKTTVLNDDLIKDEIVTVSNGNIQKYDVINESIMPDGTLVSTLKAIVSVNKLTSFCESKGIAVEFKGGLFAENIKLQQLNEKNEEVAIDNIIKTSKSILLKSFDFNIYAQQPVSGGVNSELWKVPMQVDVFYNRNIRIFYNYFITSLSGLSMTDQEIENYEKLNKNAYYCTVLKNPNEFITSALRNKSSYIKIIEFIYSISNILTNISIDNGIDVIQIKDFIKNCDNHKYGEPPSCNLRVVEYSSFIARSSNSDHYYYSPSSIFAYNYLIDLKVHKGLDIYKEIILDYKKLIYEYPYAGYSDIEKEFSTKYNPHFTSYSDPLPFYWDMLSGFGYKGTVGNYKPGLLISLIDINPKNKICSFIFYFEQNLDYISKIKEFKVINYN